ncbi:IN2-2 protein-like [Manihot esculenta]|uniref:IN2-2 protein-like n=1 Tax=Manihot esculenta TaxID=3983 RepID=UPI001CC7AA09|nr:IN2-2 protein-like [Manihot esculenta]
MAKKQKFVVPRVKLGTQGLEVKSQSMELSGLYNDPVFEEFGISIIKEAFIRGITFLDTADMQWYGLLIKCCFRISSLTSHSSSLSVFTSLMGVLPFVYERVALLIATGREDINGAKIGIDDVAAIGDGIAGIFVALPTACIFISEVVAGVGEAWQ